MAEINKTLQTANASVKVGSFQRGRVQYLAHRVRSRTVPSSG
jgi:hypothetical protein